MVQVPLGRVLDIKPEQGDSVTAPLSVVIAPGECCMAVAFQKGAAMTTALGGVSGLGEIATT